MNGKVYVVGAGPGDVGLLTVKGLHCISISDVVVYDFHINAQMLNYARDNSEFIYAGKRGGQHAMTQDEINQILVQKALKGKTVCRLKGGDPFIFGRGGEEVQELKKAGIEYEIVPGISSAVAVPAYAGIPLTHRLFSSSVAIITGCESNAKTKSAIQWEKITTGIDTLVFLMAVKNITCVTENLIAHGREPETPVAVIRWGTRSEQKTVIGTLSNIVDRIKEKDIKPPSVVVVGEVVKCRETFKWFELKPLFSQRVLVTRPHSNKFEMMHRLGAEIIEFPTVEIVPPISYGELDRTLFQINHYEWLIFTSVNAVKYFFKRYRALKKDIRELKGIKLCSIGPSTSREVEKFGINVDMMPESYNAEGLIKLFDQVKGVRFLLPRAEVAREIFPQKVRELGGIIDVPTTYRVIKPDYIVKKKRLRRLLKERKITIATFTSAATFNNFCEIIGEDVKALLKDILIAVIGPVTAKAVKQAGLKVHVIPEEATIEAMIQAILKTVGRINSSSPPSG